MHRPHQYALIDRSVRLSGISLIIDQDGDGLEADAETEAAGDHQRWR
jgi:hypothetical protein